MMKSQKMVLLFTVFFSTNCFAVSGGPKFLSFDKQTYINKLETKKKEFSDLLDKHSKCLRDQTCSAKVVKNIRNLAIILTILAAYAYVGRKTVLALREDKEPAPIKQKEKELIKEPEKLIVTGPAFPEVPKEEPQRLYPRIPEPIAVAERVPEVVDMKSKAFFDDFKNIKSSAFTYLDYLVFELEKKYGRSAIDLRFDGYSLIGAVLKSTTLDDPNKTILIEWLKNHGVQPTNKDKGLAAMQYRDLYEAIIAP